jgi:outer membrane protein TolC
MNLLFSACATSPDRSEPPAIDLPTAWSSQSFNTAPTAWLADFKSPQLEALVLEALAHSPSLEATAARFTQSVAEARISGADLKPSLGLGLNGARQKINTFGPNPTGGVIFENYDLAFDLRWEIDLWGRLHDQTSAAVARVEGYQADLDAARLSLAAQTTKSWLNLIEAQQQLALGREYSRSLPRQSTRS